MAPPGRWWPHGLRWNLRAGRTDESVNSELSLAYVEFVRQGITIQDSWVPRESSIQCGAQLEPLGPCWPGHAFLSFLSGHDHLANPSFERP